ncbi:MAG: ABC transporter substrate-binding protein, partial [Oscillospiraceae bacterium]
TEINAGLDVVEEKKAVAKTYLRAGYGKIHFACDFGPTQFPAVRKAIAYCVDRDEFAKQYSGGYAKVVDGLYGLSLWEFEENKDELSKKLNHYSYSIEKAKEILTADGWNLDKNGGKYVSGLRYKKVDGKLMPLEINWANSPNNPVSDLISTMLPDAMLKAGMKLNPTTLEWGVLLNNIYRQGIEKPEYHMYNLATGFVPIPSYWYEYSSEQKYMGNYNDHFIKDKELEKITAEMKLIPSNDKNAWAKKWVELQIRWNEVMPSIPLYSDEYHDFFIPQLKNYEPDGLWTWEEAIIYAKLEG